MTLRQEIEKLIEELKCASSVDSRYESSFIQGRGCGTQLSAELLESILSRHSEPEPTDPSQRERIATAIMLELIRSNKTPAFMQAVPSVLAADALIAELSKTAGHVRP